jgi:hypothetical protein
MPSKAEDYLIRAEECEARAKQASPYVAAAFLKIAAQRRELAAGASTSRKHPKE